MKDKRHLIVVDPTAFGGGSKIATENILALLDDPCMRITVLTADKHSWKSKSLEQLDVNRVPLKEPKWLAEKEQGIFYFVRHLFIMLHLLVVSFRFGRFDVALGASGPGVDLSLYMLKYIMGYRIIQLIHGPVAQSRTIARCLYSAQKVYYLQTCYASLQATLNTLGKNNATLPAHFHLFQNGLNDDNWPRRCQTHTASFFWAASLLKWKGLDTFLAALNSFDSRQRPRTNICYIKPQGVQLAVSEAPVLISKVSWHEQPDNLDQIRSNSNVFISTSHKEPFGLSILEALAAGQCVVIPSDGAYWDQVLVDNVNCIKYSPDADNNLSEKLLMLSQNLPLITRLGKQSLLVAKNYQAQKQYNNIVQDIMLFAHLNKPTAGFAESAS